MHLFLTGVLPFLAHNHASAAAFLTCRHHNFHGSIIPEFLSDEERVKSFCMTRQQNQLEVPKGIQYRNLHNLFVQTPLMQFSPSLVFVNEDCNESIIEPLLKTTYFTRTLQRCSVINFDASTIDRRLRFLLSNLLAPTDLQRYLTTDLLQGLSNVRSLTEFDLGMTTVENRHLEIIINSFPNLKTLTIENAKCLDPTTSISISSPPPPAKQTLRNLTLISVDSSLTPQLVNHFTKLRKLELLGDNDHVLDLQLLSSSLPLLTDLSLERYDLENVESLKTLVHLSSLQFGGCRAADSLSFLTPDSLPRLTTLRIEHCDGLSTSSFKSLTHASNLHALTVICSDSEEFNNDCLQYLENMIHLQKLVLCCADIVGDSPGPFKNLMRNLVQLEELNLWHCKIGNHHGAIAGALYNHEHNRLRVLSLQNSDVSAAELDGIGALKYTLEVLDLGGNLYLTNEALLHCKDLMKLKKLILDSFLIDDLSPLKYCLNLEELDVSHGEGVTDESFKIFSEEPNSFPNLRLLGMSDCMNLTEKVFEHLVKNNNLVNRLKELNVVGMFDIISSSATARKNICQFVNLCQLKGLSQVGDISDVSKDLRLELMRELKNLDDF